MWVSKAHFSLELHKQEFAAQQANVSCIFMLHTHRWPMAAANSRNKNINRTR